MLTLKLPKRCVGFREGAIECLQFARQSRLLTASGTQVELHSVG